MILNLGLEGSEDTEKQTSYILLRVTELGAAARAQLPSHPRGREGPDAGHTCRPPRRGSCCGHNDVTRPPPLQKVVPVGGMALGLPVPADSCPGKHFAGRIKHLRKEGRKYTPKNDFRLSPRVSRLVLENQPDLMSHSSSRPWWDAQHGLLVPAPAPTGLSQ